MQQAELAQWHILLDDYLEERDDATQSGQAGRVREAAGRHRQQSRDEALAKAAELATAGAL
eukprot:2868180-Lingulodinium_polyedra.AAC.1